MAESPQRFLRKVAQWAAERDDIVAAVLTGSRARDGRAVDEFSDLDIELFTTDPSRYAGNEWLDKFGDVIVCLASDGDGYITRLAFFSDGLKVDFQVRSEEHLETIARGLAEDEVWGRGFRPLIDKTGAISSLEARTVLVPPNQPVTEGNFRDAVEEFWFEAAHIPRYLLRDDLWVVKFRDWTMKSDLLKMIEWHARTTRGDGHDVWYIGTKMREWVDADVWTDLHRVFGHFDKADSWQALLETIKLFDRLARDVAQAHGFEYPLAAERVRLYVESFAPRFEASSLSS